VAATAAEPIQPRRPVTTSDLSPAQRTTLAAALCRNPTPCVTHRQAIDVIAPAVAAMIDEAVCAAVARGGCGDPDCEDCAGEWGDGPRCDAAK
jgi:hypothetical protein